MLTQEISFSSEWRRLCLRTHVCTIQDLSCTLYVALAGRIQAHSMTAFARKSLRTLWLSLAFIKVVLGVPENLRERLKDHGRHEEQSQKPVAGLLITDQMIILMDDVEVDSKTKQILEEVGGVNLRPQKSARRKDHGSKESENAVLEKARPLREAYGSLRDALRQNAQFSKEKRRREASTQEPDPASVPPVSDADTPRDGALLDENDPATSDWDMVGDVVAVLGLGDVESSSLSESIGAYTVGQPLPAPIGDTARPLPWEIEAQHPAESIGVDRILRRLQAAHPWSVSARSFDPHSELRFLVDSLSYPIDAYLRNPYDFVNLYKGAEAVDKPQFSSNDVTEALPFARTWRSAGESAGSGPSDPAFLEDAEDEEIVITFEPKTTPQTDASTSHEATASSDTASDALSFNPAVPSINVDGNAKRSSRRKNSITLYDFFALRSRL